MPIPSAARITSVPLGTVTSAPSIVSVTRSEGTGWPDASDPMLTVTISSLPVRWGPWRRARRRPGRTGTHGPDVRDVLVAEVLQRRHDRAGRAVTERTERLAEDRVRDVEQLLEVLHTALAALEALEDLHEPVGALTARGALAAGLVRVELRPAQHHPHDARRLVEDLQRLGAEHGSCTRHPLVVERYVEVFVGEERRRRAAGVQNLSRCPARTPPATSSNCRNVIPSGPVLSGPGDVTRERIQREPGRRLAAHAPEPLRSAEDDRRDTRDRLHVVDDGGAGVETADGGERRPQRGCPAAPRGSSSAFPRRRCMPRPPAWTRCPGRSPTEVSRPRYPRVGLGHRCLQHQQNRHHIAAHVDETPARPRIAYAAMTTPSISGAGSRTSAECPCHVPGSDSSALTHQVSGASGSVGADPGG